MIAPHAGSLSANTIPTVIATTLNNAKAITAVRWSRLVDAAPLRTIQKQIGPTNNAPDTKAPTQSGAPDAAAATGTTISHPAIQTRNASGHRSDPTYAILPDRRHDVRR